MTDKIQIRLEDLNNSRVDEILEQQQSFGMATEQLADRKVPFYYRAWFVLMVAGGLGALLCWAVIEPYFDDFTRISGTVEFIRDEARIGNPEVLALLRVNGNEVWLIKGFSTVLREAEPVPPLQLRVGQAVEIRGEVFQRGKMTSLIAHDVRILPEGSEASTEQVDLSAVALQQLFIGLAIFPLLAGMVGLFIGGADGLLCRTYNRAIVCGLVGLGAGLLLGMLASVLANLLYGLGTMAVQKIDSTSGPSYSTAGFMVQMMSRGMAWAIAGAAMGLGQGIALRSKRLIINGLLGGMVGALIGGLLFDPIDYLIKGGQMASGEAHISRMAGFMVIGLATGLMIGLVEMLARDAWIKMLAGPLAGKEFVIFRNPTRIGSSPKSDIYLFKDPEVEPTHAVIHVRGEGYELENLSKGTPTLIDGRPIRRHALRNGDQIRIGSTVLVFQTREQ
ncbi:FHA domain-containing protein [bacterium AH-315-M10]|nr:FHA domain-containing protein [bacterium AH-315-M10]